MIAENVLKDLKIYIVDISDVTCRFANDYFSDISQVEVVHTDVRRFAYDHPEVECYVSPANAFGLMTGGFDAALSGIFGWNFQEKVQAYIKEHFYGEQVVGSSFYITADNPRLSLIHTPTMQYPSVIKDDKIVYYCMRSTLICALEHNVKSMVIPVFGGACGEVKHEIAIKHMYDAYMQIVNQQWVTHYF